MRCAVALALLLAGCGSGGGGASGGGDPPPVVPLPAPLPVYAVPAPLALGTADVEGVLARAIEEANARRTPAVIAVVDRVGNVLAVFAMTGARTTATLRPGAAGDTDAQGVVVPAALAAIAKAVTGAYLSSGGNAFSTRTASQIVQERFPPTAAATGLEAGPLFGVQFSSLPCSDLVRRFGTGAAGPKRSPLGLTADPGGLPLYKAGVLVGAVGAMSDGDYGFDAETADLDRDDEEFVALAGSATLEAAAQIRADRVAVDGTTLRFADATPAGLLANPGAARPFAALNGAFGSLVAVAGYAGAAVLAGTPYGTEASGVRAATPAEFANPDAFVLTDGAGTPRYPVQAGSDAAETPAPLTAAETRALLEEAFKIMSRARAQIRRPLDSRAQVSIAVTDTRGAVLGLVRSPDAPLFGIDVALQKARSAAFVSSRFAAGDLGAATTAAGAADPNVRDFVTRTDAFAGSALLRGGVAVTTRTIGNLARPFFPDGEVGRPNGPLSRPIARFSPFSTGLQSALIVQNLAVHLGAAGTAGDPAACTFLPAPNRLANGLQIFPGSAPVYRGGTLVGAVGVSGDGIDQDDMVAFLGVHNAGVRLGGLGNAPSANRADQLVLGAPGVRLRYVQCPFAPFLDTAEQNVCQGK